MLATKPKLGNYWVDLSHRADLDPLRGFLASRNYGHQARTIILHQAAANCLRPGCMGGLAPEFLDADDIYGAEWALAECRDKTVGDFLAVAMPCLEAKGWEVAGFDARGALLSYDGRTFRLILSDTAADDLSLTPTGRLSAAESAARNAERAD